MGCSGCGGGGGSSTKPATNKKMVHRNTSGSAMKPGSNTSYGVPKVKNPVTFGRKK